MAWPVRWFGTGGRTLLWTRADLPDGSCATGVTTRILEPCWPCVAEPGGTAPSGVGLEVALLLSQPHALLSVKQISGLLFFKHLEILLTFC